MYGLEENKFTGLLDNSSLKHGKRLYGTSLMCHKPVDVVGRPRDTGEPQLRVFINIGSYNEEVKTQLLSINANVECILL
jgi:hypothetical protein